jgi:hypothetical protein
MIIIIIQFSLFQIYLEGDIMKTRARGFIFSVLIISLFMFGCGGGGGGGGGDDNSQTPDSEGPWIGNWVQVNFLGTDENGNVEEWDSDSTNPKGIGFVADVSESEWVQRDDYGDGCTTICSLTVYGDQYSMRGKSTTCSFPYDFTEYTKSGYFEFPDDNTMIQWNEYTPGVPNKIVAFKWKRK